MRRARLAAGLAGALLLAASPATAAAPPRPPALEARSWVLIDLADGERLAARAPDRELPVASATKLMTAYVALAELGLRESVRAPRYQALPVESVLGLRPNERIEVRDLLYALLMASANDAANALAVAAAGSTGEFVSQMNAAADRLGLEHSSWANPIGLDDPGNYSSAADLAALTQRLRRERLFRRIVDTETYELRSGGIPRQITSRNTLLLTYPFVTGVKTGHTRGAGYVLVSSAERDGAEMLAVVIGAGSEAARDAESLRLLDYGFSRYRRARPVKPGRVLAAVDVRWSDDDLELVGAEPISLRVRDDRRVGTEIEVPDLVEGPIARGERIGRIRVTIDGKPVAVTRLVAAEAVAAPSFLVRNRGPLLGGAGAIAVILMAMGMWSIRERRRRHQLRARSRLSRARAADAAERLRREE